MNPAAEQPLVPPRPNLGPEPWTDGGGLAGPTLVLALVAFGLLAIGAWARRRSRRRATLRLLSAPAADASPESRLLRLCGQLRATLAARFGPELQARTTEEIADDPQIQQAVGAELLKRMTEFLLVGDRLKFAGDDVSSDVLAQLDGYPSWAASLEASPRRPARAVKDPTGRSPDDRTGRRSPRTRPRLSEP